jgi:galactokinase
MSAADLTQRFRAEFKAEPRIFRAPGRVNLIGEHTDYNDGFVMPCAIGFYAHVALAPRSDTKLVLRSSDFPDSFEFDVQNLPQRKRGAWCDYILGVIHQLGAVGVAPTAANVLIHGEVPIGSGLSSSAALEVASALAFLSLQDKELPLKSVAQLCQKAENEFVGARVGIMDQFVSCHGKLGHAVRLDCRSLEFELVPVPDAVRLVICNTMVKHELSGGEYNQRREQCEEGVRILARAFPGIRALRDVSSQQLESQRQALPDLIFRRCLHVVQEDNRVLEVTKLLRAGDLARVGQLMHDSHVSLRDLYQVSCQELDSMVDAAKGLPGYIGGRMTGGGFGGCTVNLVRSAEASAFADEIKKRYKQKTGILADVYICSAANGAGAETD